MKRATWLLPFCLAVVFSTSSGCGRRESAGDAEPQVQAEATSKPGDENPVVPARKEERTPGASHHAKTIAQEEDLFTKPTVLRIDIEIPRTGMNLLRRTGWGGGGGEQRPTAKATIREGGVVYTNVAVHLKGAAGSFRPVDDQPAMTLNFDKFVTGQSFHGLHKISLNNSVQDPSLLSEKICREFFNAAGVPVPRAGHALVKFNGRQLGMYVMLEGANKQFLKRYFKNATGNLYDGGFCKDINEPLSVNSGDNPNDDSGLNALIAAVRESRQSLAPLEKTLDVDRFISMIAVEVMVIHWDGYGLNKNNWRVFHDLDSNKMVFIPHGLDQTFGISQRGSGEIMPRSWSGEVATAVMRTAEGRRRYRERFSQLYTNVFKLDQILSRIDEIEAVIEPAWAKFDHEAARRQEQQAAWFKQQIVQRNKYIQRQLGTPVLALKFGSEGVVKLSGWKPSTVKSGDPTLNQAKDPQGNVLLGISANGSSINSGSWRTRTVLQSGQYRFEGRVRANGVGIEPGDQRAGAGLRISKGTPPRKLTGTTDWTAFAYEFQIEDEASDVELICELARAVKGEAWFDEGSLRLVRVR